MQNADSSSLFDDLDAALQSGSSEKRVATLRPVTDLFLSESDRLNDLSLNLARHSEIGIAGPILTNSTRLKIDFDKLSKSNAQRLLRFWQAREVSARSA